MRIFVSSSFEDLREHRAAAIRVLRQLGHQVLAMEDMLAGAATPLAKVVDMVDHSEAYLGVFAWRYGHVPTAADQPKPPPGVNVPAPAGPGAPTPPGISIPVEGAVYGETSITHYEYLRAVQRKLPVMAFLLDETYPWPPQYIDGFDRVRPQAPENADKIRALRRSLQQERVVSWFTTPSDLEARVSAAVTMAGLTSQLDLQPATALPPGSGVASDSSGDYGITDAIISAGDRQPALKIDLATTWWSTRLYLLASLAQRLTEARRILIVDTRLDPSSTTTVQPPGRERLVGQLSTSAILSIVGPRVPQLGTFELWLQQRPTEWSQLQAEIQDLLEGWRTAFGDAPGAHMQEEAAKIDLTAQILQRWFGDAMLRQPLRIADLQRASPVDLLRLLDYPNECVPVLTRHSPTPGGTTTERIDVVDKRLLNSRLARSYLVELLDRDRIVTM
jgi:hypothetical protein